MISIIISTRNRAGMLRQALASVLSQEPCGHEIEVIVSDDDSVDDTESVVREHAGVHYVRTRQGTASGTRNDGMALAHGEWLAFLDDDDVWLPNKLRRSFEVLAADPEARAVVSFAHICEANLERCSEWRLAESGSLPGTYDALAEGVPSPSMMVVHREVFDKIGLFDPTVPRAEDRDLCMRISLAGFRIALLPEPLVLYRLREKPDGEIIYATYCTTMRVLRRHLAPHGHAPRPLPADRVRATFRRVRGWYAGELLTAARQEADRARARRFSHLAFDISPLHWLRHAGWSR